MSGKWIAAALMLGAMMGQAALAADSSDGGGDGASRARSAGRSLLGKPGPMATLTSIDDERIDLASLYGKKPVYLKFWATWCVPCREQMPGFEKIFEQYGERIAVVAVNTGFSDSEKDVRAFRAQYGLHMPVVVDDGSLAAQLNLRVTPQHVLIGLDGRVAHVGHLDDKALHAALERALVDKGQPLELAPGAPLAHETVFGNGDTVRGLSASTIAGKTVTLGATAGGKPRALVFFSPWCESYLRESQPATSRACRRVREDYRKLSAQKGVEWLGISGGLWASEADLASYARTSRSSLPLALDKSGALFRAFGIRRIPSVVLLDGQGRVARVLGPDDSDLAGAVRAVQVR